MQEIESVGNLFQSTSLENIIRHVSPSVSVFVIIIVWDSPIRFVSLRPSAILSLHHTLQRLSIFVLYLPINRQDKEVYWLPVSITNNYNQNESNCLSRFTRRRVIFANRQWDLGQTFVLLTLCLTAVSTDTSRHYAARSLQEFGPNGRLSNGSLEYCKHARQQWIPFRTNRQAFQSRGYYFGHRKTIVVGILFQDNIFTIPLSCARHDRDKFTVTSYQT